MIGTSAPDGSPIPPSLVPPDDAVFSFECTDWIDPPVFVTKLPETTPETNIRALAEQEYRKSTNPTAWHRYLTLGRYVVDGFTFDEIMDEDKTDPLKMFCMIWFQYTYHIDHNIDIPTKLQAWSAQRAQPFLQLNSVSAFTLDTTKTSWISFSRSQHLADPWTPVDHKSKKGLKKAPLPKSYLTAASLIGTSKPGTITEEASKDGSSNTNRGQKRSNSDLHSKASDGKQSVLIPDLNVPVCDGTYRVTLRWKTSIDTNRLSRQTQEIKEDIYNLLNDIFDDDDGLLYKWQQEGTSERNSISKMTPTEVRQYISPSVGLMPSQSTMIIPIRFGFSSSTPSKWRNLQSTKEKLDKHNVTVSFSNSATNSGNLVVAGYILLKAPMTTHRLRYLQSLRRQLPPSTPPFDILLHKRTPSDQLIPHLAVQCGHKHVHSLCEALSTILTGNGSALYIPRFAFSQMTDNEAEDLFHTHDVHVKSLRWLPLSPLLSNLDRPRKEFFPDGSVIERTTRDWARSITTLDGTSSAQCDVVNGGLDQLCYLLFTPQHLDAATQALDEYKKRLYPFSHREAQFREKVGPPPFIHLSKHVIANLDFIKNLGKSNASQPGDNTTCQSENSEAQQSDGTPESALTDSSSKASRPPTPAESLRQRYRQQNPADTSNFEDDSTSESTTTDMSKLSRGRMSTSSAKLREIDNAIQRQKQLYDKKEAMHSDRIAFIERQLHRLNDFDSKLDDVKTDFGSRLHLFEARMVETVKNQVESSTANMANMNNNMMKLMAAVEKMSSSNFKSNSSSSGSSMSAESLAMIQSPEHKRRRSAKKPLKESIRRHLDKELQLVVDADSSPSHQAPSQDTAMSDAIVASTQQDSFDSLDIALQNLAEAVLDNNVPAPTQQDDLAPPPPNTNTSSATNNITRDPESQNTAGSTLTDTQATPSPGRDPQT